MLALSIETAAIVALRAAERSWVVFLQTELPGGVGSGRIKIEGLQGRQLAKCLTTIVRECPYTIHLVGMIPTDISPVDHVLAIADSHAHIHDGWFEPTPDLIAFIAATAQDAIRELLGDTQAGAADDLIDIEELAGKLNCSVPTIRRMIERDAIPFFRLGRAYRFNLSDVLASLQQR